MAKDHTMHTLNRELAVIFVKFGMRASIISTVLNIPLTESRTLYRELTGHPSPSGRTPHSTSYYFAPVMVLHASLFYLYFKTARRTLADRAAEPTAYSYQRVIDRRALAAAYEAYLDAAGDTALLSIDRAWCLVQEMLTAPPGAADAIREANCRPCGTYILISPESASLRHVCPVCQGSLDVSRRLKGRSGRKPNPTLPSIVTPIRPSVRYPDNRGAIQAPALVAA